ncbi:hypothetical protein GGR57DRAFT_507849 [Xylariaceae sp. FL1272]|nr:hypothetical protein GGR57DRAFT_507849 [Xylariaceae sp. FL1272]
MESENLGRGPLIIGIIWALSVVCIVLVSTRIYVRLRILRATGSDDWLMLLAVSFQIASSAILTEAYAWDLGEHDADLTFDPQIVNIFKWGWIWLDLCHSRDVALFLVRLFGVKQWLKWFLIICTAIQTIISVAFLIITFTSTTPVEALWDPRTLISQRDPNMRLNAAIAAQSFLTFADFTYVLLPVIVIWRLNMPLRQKIGLVALVALSLVTVAASILKTILANIIPKITTQESATIPDVQYVSSLSISAGNVEQCLVIILGCTAPLRPVAKLPIAKRRLHLYNL